MYKNMVRSNGCFSRDGANQMEVLGKLVETGLLLVCKQIRNEFLVTIFSVQELHLPRSRLLPFRDRRVLSSKTYAGLIPASMRPLIKSLVLDGFYSFKHSHPIQALQGLPSLETVRYRVCELLSIHMEECLKESVDNKIDAKIREEYNKFVDANKLDSWLSVEHEVIFQLVLWGDRRAEHCKYFGRQPHEQYYPVVSLYDCINRRITDSQYR